MASAASRAPTPLAMSASQPTPIEELEAQPNVPKCRPALQLTPSWDTALSAMGTSSPIRLIPTDASDPIHLF